MTPPLILFAGVETASASPFRTLGAALFGVALTVGYSSTASAAGATERISVSSAGKQGNLNTRFSALSADARFAAFSSYASNLVADDKNGKSDIFLRDLRSGKTTRLSIAADGAEGDGDSFTTKISADGRYLVFNSAATNLVAGDSNNAVDLFFYERFSGKLERILTADGQQMNGSSYPTDISADGRFVVFASEADNLVPGDTNNAPDVFILDRADGTIERVSVATDGTQAQSGTYYYGLLSDDGRYVAYFSDSSNLVADDTNGVMDAFVRDRQKNTTTRISVDSNGLEGNGESYFPRLSSDGRFITFSSDAGNLVPGDTNKQTDVFLYDQKIRQTSLISHSPDGKPANGASSYSSISADGRFIVYNSYASNLVVGDENGNIYDAFVHDRKSGKNALVSIGDQGQASNGLSMNTDITRDGRYVAFFSEATNLVADDTNSVVDSFLRDRLLMTHKSADLSVTQSVSPAVIHEGQEATYTLTVHNAGPDEGSGATLTGILPQQASLVAAAADRGKCSRGKTVICRLGKLAAGENATVTLTVRADAAGKLRNQAYVGANPQDPAFSNNSSTTEITVRE